MVTNLSKYKNDLLALIERGDKLYYGLLNELKDELGVHYKKLSQEHKDEIEKCKFKSQYDSWYNESIALIKQLIPDRLDDFQSYYKFPKRKDITYATYTISDYLIGLVVHRGDRIIASRKDVLDKFNLQRNIVKSLNNRFESSLYEIRQLLQADMFDSEVDAARELCEKGFYRAAGAICGVVIEKHLCEVCVHNNILVTKKSPSISDYNELLKSNGVIDIPVWRNIQRLADIRNICDHHKQIEPTQELIEELIAGTDKIIKTVF